MAPKKKPRPDAAQQLIDSLLDDAKPAKAEPRSDESVLLTDLRDSHDAVDLGSGSSTTIQVNKSSSDPDTHHGHSAINLSLDHSHQVRTQTPVELPPLPSVSENDLGEQTLKIVAPDNQDHKTADRFAPTEVRPSVAPPEHKPYIHPENETRTYPTMKPASEPLRPGPAFPSSSSPSSSAATLKQSENLRIAQARITDLEHELDRFRRENEQLGSAGETLRRRTDELLTKLESLEMQNVDVRKIGEEEQKVLRGQLQAKERENLELRGRVEEMEGRLESNFKKIRVRERELEHRLEIVKMETSTLVGAKDKMILELKRQIDQLAHESDFAKQKTQELFNQYKDKQETIRRVVRALRIALTVLEGDEDNVVPLKKAE